MIQETSIKFEGNFFGPLSSVLFQAFLYSLALKTKLPERIIMMHGASGRKYRYLINNLIGKLNSPSYLEVGSYAGSTVCSAIYGNSCKALCIDNWSQFGGPKNLFVTNVQSTLTGENSVQLLEQDFRAVDFSKIGVFDVYLFDGPHAEQDQFDGIVLAQVALADSFILIVDDWNWPEVRRGTYEAMKACRFAIDFSIEIRTSQNDSHASISGPGSDWHNGYYMCVCKKN